MELVTRPWGVALGLKPPPPNAHTFLFFILVVNYNHINCKESRNIFVSLQKMLSARRNETRELNKYSLIIDCETPEIVGFGGYSKTDCFWGLVVHIVTLTTVGGRWMELVRAVHFQGLSSLRHQIILFTSAQISIVFGGMIIYIILYIVWWPHAVMNAICSPLGTCDRIIRKYMIPTVERRD